MCNCLFCGQEMEDEEKLNDFHVIGDSMKPYGMKRNWNAVEDVGKNGRAGKAKKHSQIKKIYHRIARRHFKSGQKRTRGNIL